MTKTKDQTTMDLLNEVNKRKKEIAKIDKCKWKTNLNFRYVVGTPTINLQVVNSVPELVDIAAYISDRIASYDAMATSLGIAVPELVIDGYSAADWLDDVKTRINKVTINDKKRALEKLESRLNAIISPELRAEMELKAIQEELS